MAVRIACTHCNSGLSMPESMYGKPVRCPKCQKIFECPPGPAAVAATPAPAPEPRKRPAPTPSTGNPFEFDPGAAPAAEAPPSDGSALDFEPVDRLAGQRGWGKVQGGVLLVLISTAFFYLGYAVPFCMLELPDTKPERDTQRTLLTVVGICILMGVIVAGLGTARCAGAPADSGTRGIAYTTAMFMLIAAITGCLVLIMRFSAGSLEMAKLLRWLIVIYISSIFAGFLVFQFYLVLAGQALKHPGLAGTALAFVIATLGGVFFFALRAGVKGMLPLPGDFDGLDMREKPSLLEKLVPLLIVTAITGWFAFNVILLMRATGGSTSRRRTRRSNLSEDETS